MKHSAELQINPESASSNWFIRHWRGEISLGEAYWLNGVLLANCLPALIVFGYDAGQPFSHSLRAGAAAAVTLRVLQITIWIWATVGIIRFCKPAHGARREAFLGQCRPSDGLPQRPGYRQRSTKRQHSHRDLDVPNRERP